MNITKWLLIIFLAGMNVFGQTTKSLLVVEMPRILALPMVAVQPDCPIRFEDVKRFALLDGGEFTSYRLRNIGSKSISKLTVATSEQAESTWSNHGQSVPPGELVPLPDDPRIKIVPWTDTIRTDLNRKGPMKGFVVLMILEVEFTDGSRFEDKEVYTAMTNFAEKMDEAFDYREQMEKRRKDQPK